MTEENDAIFEQAERITRCLRMIKKNANCDAIAQECGLDGRFVLALMLLEAEATA